MDGSHHEEVAAEKRPVTFMRQLHDVHDGSVPADMESGIRSHVHKQQVVQDYLRTQDRR